MNLRKFLLTTFLAINVLIVFSQEWITITSDKPSPASIELTAGDISNSTLNINISGFTLTRVSTPRGDAYTVGVGEATPLLEAGMPDLPKVVASLMIPDQAKMEISIESFEYKDYTDILIAPSKGNLLRNIDPATVPYTYGAAYDRNEFYPAEMAFLREPYIMRDHRGQALVVCPFAYNPVTKTLRVYYNISLSVNENGTSAVNPLIRNTSSNKLSSEFASIYKRHFLNAGVQSERYTPIEEQGNMLIISFGAFMDEMQPFINWKTQMGMSVEMVDVASIGTNATAIKAYVADYYAENGLTFLLIIGDNAQVPTVTSGDLGGPSDHAYGYISGNDHYPEVLVGRFSAETPEQVTTQVNRTVTYEKEPDVSYDWFSKGVGIASDQGPGDDNEYDYQHMRNIRTDLLGFTYTTVAEVYDGSQGGEDLPGNPSPATVATELNAGRSVVNYIGHGSDVSWGTSGFSNSDVNQLTNNDMWPFIYSVACVNGNFTNQTCFAEAWLRATNANGPTGAIATLMSTINQSWDPPMEGQDEMVDILIESYSDNIKRTFAGIGMNGCAKMNDTYGSGGYEMTDTWLVFGDPSVMVRTAMPADLIVDHSDVAFIGSNSFTIESDVNGALACITMDGEIMGTAYVENGEATIEIPMLGEVGVFTMTVTAFNHMPYITEVEVIPLDGPYVIYNNYSVNDASGNDNQQLDYGENVFLELAMENAGTEDAADAIVSISSTDPYVTINNATATYPLIPAGQTISLPDGFNISVTNNVPDGYQIPFTYTVSVDTNMWDGEFIVTAHSVALHYNGLTLNDAGGNNNGRIDPGETVNLSLKILNAGTAPAYNVFGMLNSSDPYVLINTDSIQYGTIDGYQVTTGVYTITALPTTPMGYNVSLSFDMYADAGFTATGSPTFVVGQIPALIIDLDLNHNSGPTIKTALENNGITVDYTTAWPMIIGPYKSVFVCLGTYPNNRVLTTGQGNALANFMNINKGRVYMEGSDTWYNNPQTAAHSLFKIEGTAAGSNDLGMINGVEGSFAAGIDFNFYGDNNAIDHIQPVGNAFAVLQNVSPSYFTTVAYADTNYRTIGSSMEFAGVNYTVRDTLMFEYINFFGLNNAPLLANFIADPQVVCEADEVSFTDYSAGEIASWQWEFPGAVPEISTEQNPTVTYRTSGSYNVTLTITDSTGISISTTKSNYITVEQCVAVNDVQHEKISLYPNPATSHFTIVVPGNEPTEVSIYSLTGTLVTKHLVNNSMVINTNSFEPGIYLVNTLNRNLNNTYKLVITK